MCYISGGFFDKEKKELLFKITCNLYDFRYVFYTEDGRQASSLEDLNGQTVEVAEAPVQRSQQKMAYARMMADRQSAGSSSGSSRLVKNIILFQRWY